MKKIFAIALALLLVFMLSACSIESKIIGTWEIKQGSGIGSQLIFDKNGIYTKIEYRNGAPWNVLSDEFEIDEYGKNGLTTIKYKNGSPEVIHEISNRVFEPEVNVLCHIPGEYGHSTLYHLIDGNLVSGTTVYVKVK